MERQVIQSVGFRNVTEGGAVTGFQLRIRLPYYRGVYLSQIKPGRMVIDGETFEKEDITWVVDGVGYSWEEMRVNNEAFWHPLRPAVLRVKKPGGLSQGFHDIEYGFCCTHSYMPPFMDALEKPNEPEFVYFPEFGRNTHYRRLLIV